MEVRILGPLEVIGAAGMVPIESGRQRAVLALLALRMGESVPTDQMIDALWGDAPPPSARHALGVHVAGLRRTLGPGVIETTAAGYRLSDESAELDLRRFQALVADATRARDAGDTVAAANSLMAALALWRGPALPDLGATGVGAAEQTRLVELHDAAFERWVDVELERGRPADVLPALRRAVAEAPMHEGLQARLMLVLYQLGRQAEALDVYHRARATLADELGLEPGPELERMQRAILEHDPALGPTLGATPDPMRPQAAATPLAAAMAPWPPAPAEGNESRREARRTVTALALDAGGDDAIDPEADAVQRAALHAAFVEAVAVHGGSVRAVEDRQALALFGAPTLHEDDAARAIRAANSIRERVPAAGLRIGLATGEVLLALEADGSVDVAGPVAGSARRLASAAEPGEIVVDDRTATLVRDIAQLEPADAGRAVVRSLDDRRGPGRVERPIVGRQRELRQLEDALEGAREERRCRLFTLIGPPGIGKSRLVEAFVARARDDAGARVVRGHCLAYGDQSGMWALRELVLDAIGANEAEGPDAIRAALLDAFAGHRRASALAAHVAVAIGASDGASAAEEGAWAVRLFLERLARDRALVVVVDDIHWAPASLLTLLEAVVDASRGAPILLLCVARPELIEAHPTWGGGKVNATSLLLGRLRDGDVSAIVSNLLAGAAMGPHVWEAVAARAEGNPLFVEEYVRALVDSGGLRLEPGGWQVAVPGAGAALAAPTSIIGLLTARIESLPASERDLCQRAAVVGRGFNIAAVAALLSATGRESVEASIGALVSRELIEPDPDDDQRFRFRHVLIRDAAYGALPIRDRIRLHEAHADWLGAAHGQPVADDLIGIHLEQAYRYLVELGDRSDATRHVGRRAGERLASAGRRAMARGDVSLAGDLFVRAMDLLPDDEPDRTLAELELAEAHSARGEFDLALAAARSIVERAPAAGPAVSAETRWLAILMRDRLAYFRGEATDEGLANARKASDEAGRTGLDRVSWAAWRTLGEAALTRGQLAEATRCQRKALSFARRAGDRHAEAETQLELGGYPMIDMSPVSEAFARATEIRDWARASGQTWPEAVATTQIGRAVAMAGRFDEGRQLVADGISTIRDLGMRWLEATTAWYTALVEFLAGDYAAAAAVLEPAFARLTALNAGVSTSYTAAQLSRMLFLLGRYDEAETYVDLAERDWPSDRHGYDMSFGTARALLLSRAGRDAEAERAARVWLARVAPTDLCLARATGHADLAAVLNAVGRRAEAEAERAAAIELYERKGVIILADRLRESVASA